MFAWCVAVALALAGCAKFPNQGGSGSGRRVILRMVMASPLNPNYVYMVALRPSTSDNPTETGPVPVIAQPWGNGFVFGDCTYFVRWDALQSPPFQIYKFVDTNLTQWFQTGAPVSYVDIGSNSRVFQVELDLLQLAANQTEADSFRTLQLNFLTMNRVPQGTDTSKVWEALGDNNDPFQRGKSLTISLRNSTIYTNASLGNLEPTGDVIDPSLDIVDFSIEVRLP